MKKTKLLSRDKKKNLKNKKWMYTFFLNRRLNLKKKSKISKSIFKYNAVSIKIPKDGGREFNKLILSFTEQTKSIQENSKK